MRLIFAKTCFTMLIALVVSACGTVAHSPQDYRKIANKKREVHLVEEPIAVVRDRLLMQTEKCFGGLQSSYEGYGGDKISKNFGISYIEKSEMSGSLQVPLSFVASTIGITLSSGETFAAIADLRGEGGQTEVAIYSRHRSIMKAFRVWALNESKACPRGH